MPHTHKVLDTFMHVAERAGAVWGPASHSDPTAPVVHKHDAYEEASEAELKTFEVETDSEGHHYAFRRDEKPPMTHH
ncbi:hypothetical protein GCM10012320_06550 [Sinomonas cellulolyticus]|jgi:hypothetical protein|uniref:Uncharacterized protein n=1 Tax=Sinomonas cellulolyticus TaxID=2801916 RepID=A0ABS1K3X6_9MICC|nr:MULTISPECIES: hypothetical protein [Sinomonas]MBL0705982.1 hypothetical protein [Sinomonas cellulolyticus]GHG42921.1 hypothetical protein GCM10012320_06550 [Sinomonas sp. KCTC 49339]